MKIEKMLDKFMEDNPIIWYDKRKEENFKKALKLITNSREIYRDTLFAIRELLTRKMSNELSAEETCNRILDITIDSQNKIEKIATVIHEENNEKLGLKILLKSEIYNLQQIYEEYAELSMETKFKSWFIDDQGELHCTLDNMSLEENYLKIQSYKDSIREISKRIDELKSKIKEEEEK